MKSQLSKLPKELLIEIIEKQNSFEYIEDLDECAEHLQKIKERKRYLEKRANELIKENIKEKFPGLLRGGKVYQIDEVNYYYKPKHYRWYKIWITITYKNFLDPNIIKLDFQMNKNGKSSWQYLHQVFENDYELLLKYPELTHLCEHLLSHNFLQLTKISRLLM